MLAVLLRSHLLLLAIDKLFCAPINDLHRSLPRLDQPDATEAPRSARVSQGDLLYTEKCHDGSASTTSMSKPSRCLRGCN